MDMAMVINIALGIVGAVIALVVIYHGFYVLMGILSGIFSFLGSLGSGVYEAIFVWDEKAKTYNPDGEKPESSNHDDEVA